MANPNFAEGFVAFGNSTNDLYALASNFRRSFSGEFSPFWAEVPDTETSRFVAPGMGSPDEMLYRKRRMQVFPAGTFRGIVHVKLDIELPVPMAFPRWFSRVVGAGPQKGAEMLCEGIATQSCPIAMLPA